MKDRSIAGRRPLAADAEKSDRGSSPTGGSHAIVGVGSVVPIRFDSIENGRIELSDGPLGGLRATLTVSTSVEAVTPGANPD